MTTKVVTGLSRQALRSIYTKVDSIIANYGQALPPMWARSYNDLAAAVNTLDAMLARQKSSVHTFKVAATDKPTNTPSTTKTSKTARTTGNTKKVTTTRQTTTTAMKKTKVATKYPTTTTATTANKKTTTVNANKRTTKKTTKK